MELTKEEILDMHVNGKISVELLRELNSQKDLSVAYTPGVAEVCKEIKNNSCKADQYTSKGNLVGVVTDGTAVLGLGDIGPLASLPVMEGKAVLFKKFGDVNAWPVPLENVRVDGCSGRTDVKKFIEATVAIAGMYGGLNIEDVAAPECFEIEDKLDEMLDIPVFHDDQWGTAIITLAGIKNYCLLSGKKIEDLDIVINGAGAAGIRISDMLKDDGAKKVIMVDSRGVIYDGREGLNDQKKRHVVETDRRTLKDAMEGADVFIGVSIAGCVTKEMISSMKDYPAIFAMANPVPEIMPEDVKEVMGDKPYVIGTGRSDFPNQVNNVLGFPFIFRGALDVCANKITMGMKRAASEALAELARVGDVDEEVKKAYARTDFEFGNDYVIPVPFDPRLINFIGNAVSLAALKEGVSKYCKGDLDIVDIGNSLEVVVKDLAYFDEKCYLGILIDENVKYVLCGDELIFENKTFDLRKDVGEFFRFVSMHFDKKARINLNTSKSSIDA
jgi:malate dehydrogenase (oxaloacetate-decarboxylating)(NADP+)